MDLSDYLKNEHTIGIVGTNCHKKGDNYSYSERDSVINFNSLYAVTINEEFLNYERYSSGKCDMLDMAYRPSISNLPYPNQCAGILRYCWFKSESDARKRAYKHYMDVLYVRLNGEVWLSREGKEAIAVAKSMLDHTGNICNCLCERSYNPITDTPRGKLLDSICFDPVSVDDDHVVTGVRFNRHKNTIYLELQQGKLENGKVNPITVKWKISNKCNNSKKVITFRGSSYDGLRIILEDIIFSENKIVTGVTLGESLHGRYININGTIDMNQPKIYEWTHCVDRTVDLMHGYDSESHDLLPSTWSMSTNEERSESCKHHISFTGTSFEFDETQNVVPYIDLQEIVTDPPQPIRGIGWYYRGRAGYGGFLALKIFI